MLNYEALTNNNPGALFLTREKAGAAGFSEDGTVFALQLDLQPGHAYELLLTGRNFESVGDGYLKFNTC